MDWSIFYDKDGIFMWSSVAAIMSFVVFSFQIFQLFYQRSQIKKLKKFDVMIEFRINDLKKLKEYIIIYDDFISSEAIESLGKNHESKESINMLLNINNPKYKELSSAFVSCGVFLIDKESMGAKERVSELLKLSNNLIDMYKLYEDEEIKAIEKYI
ncbi:hypothetical protein [uncultured Vagococcus sp.]|uniref:hypothetical protein n=1 Tax=uncultured Vagococcus sp. TaxID=189676 RepID=UPI0028D586A9|nr:hypothetical protein [uncultured Vagococcus sp.]